MGNEIKVPPHDLDAEEAILCAILINNEAIPQVVDLVCHEDFYREAHSLIFSGMVSLYEKREPIDLITLSNQLKKKDLLDKAGGIDVLESISESVSTSAAVLHHCKLVKELSIKRQLIRCNSNLSEMCFQRFCELDEIIEIAEKNLNTITNNLPSGNGFHHIENAVKKSFKKIEKIAEKKSGLTGVPTGFTDFDKITAGLQPSDLIIIAGRPSMGKTALALNIAYNASKKDFTTGIFSLEMSEEQLGTRLLGSDSHIKSDALRKGYLKDKDWIKLTESAACIIDLPIYINDQSDISVIQMKAKCQKLQREHGLDLIIVDYIQLMTGKGQSREREIADISRSLKGMAKDLNIPVVALSQLNRKVEDRTNKKPKLADLRESGAIEQDADVIAFIYRDEVYNPKTEKNNGVAEIIIAKHRNGPTGYFKLIFRKEITKFEDHISDEQYGEVGPEYYSHAAGLIGFDD